MGCSGSGANLGADSIGLRSIIFEREPAKALFGLGKMHSTMEMRLSMSCAQTFYTKTLEARSLFIQELARPEQNAGNPN